jgi:replication factor C large subunit
MTCNFRDDSKFGSLYKLASPVIEIERSKPEDVGLMLKRIATQEKITITDEQIKVIAIRAEGDFRSAINDLQGLTQGTKEIEGDALNNINSERDTVIKVQEFLIKFFLTTTVRQAKDVLDDVQQEDIDFNNIHKWINENILNYITKPLDLRFMFENLAFVDTILGYIKRTQDYSHLSYFFDILGGGIRFAKNDTILSKSRMDFPRFFRTRATPDDEYSLRLQQIYHASLNDILKEVRPILKQFLTSSSDVQSYFAAKFGCDPKQLEDII